MEHSIDREKVIKGLEYCTTHYNCRNLRGQSCPYIGNCKPLEDATGNTLIRDALVLLKEQEEQKRKWLQAIADTQLAVSPTGYETEEDLAKRTGEWNGLQMAWNILTEGQ